MPRVPDWMPEEELAILASQPKAATPASNEQLAMQIFRDSAPLAAEVISMIMINGEKEATRLAAAKYISDRVLGKISDSQVSESKDVWSDLFSSVTREPTASERAEGKRVSRLS